jgi:hypothetical protein
MLHCYLRIDVKALLVSRCHVRGHNGHMLAWVYYDAALLFAVAPLLL